MEFLLIVGLVFVLTAFLVRYYLFRTMTNRVCSLDSDNDYCRRHYTKNIDRGNNPYQHCEVLYGETPNGGVKTVICYIDEENNRVKKERASKVLIREFDANNKPVYEGWVTLEANG